MSGIAVAPPAALFDLAVDRWTAPFWEAAREHRLVAARCADCGAFRMPATPFCPGCLSQAIDWTELSGLGTVFSYTVVRRAITPEMEGALPYVPALIDLDGAPGARLIAAVVGVPVEAVTVGARVRVSWEDRPDGVSVPRFTLVPAG
jgi:uncharacterized OB-fold protein